LPNKQFKRHTALTLLNGCLRVFTQNKSGCVKSVHPKQEWLRQECSPKIVPAAGKFRASACR